YYAQMTPILVEAIREMNLNVTQIADMTRDNTWRDSLISWLGNASNKITRIFTGELCLYDENGQTECINASELRALKQSQNIQTTPEVLPPTVDTPPEDTPPPTEEPPAVEPPPEVLPPTVDTPPEDTPSETGTE
ncbi:MAG TPA: hypothetical protein PKZ56_02215, partial [Candidatus Paceibacterota bacterium]|nr:hypothetical protein [Candidatus Paceibacterota bacterium]